MEKSVQEQTETVEPCLAVTKDDNRAILKRIDLRLIPMMVFTYSLQFYDKTLLNQAALFHIIDDLGLSSTTKVAGKIVVSTQRYSYVGMIFYCGYILGVYPASLLAQKYSASRVCAGLVMAWGIVETLTVACTSFAGIMVQRFFLGFCESGVAPAFVIACSQWYTPRESALRIAIWWAGNGLVSMIGPLTSYGFGSIKGSLAGWQNLYLFAGLLTFAWSFVVLLVLPDNPQVARFLDERERDLALNRIRDNNMGIAEPKIKISQVIEASCDPAIWLVTTLMFGVVATNSITGLFASIIISDLGFNNLRSLCLQIPIGFLGICCGLLPSTFVYKTDRGRLTSLSVLMSLSIAGTAMLYAVPRKNVGLVLTGYYLNNFYAGCPGLILASIAANTAGHTKKTAVSSAVFVAYCAGSIMSPLIMKKQDNYHGGFLGILVCQCYAAVAAQVLRRLYKVRNKRRDVSFGAQILGQPFSDETDLENTNFRYHT